MASLSHKALSLITSLVEQESKTSDRLEIAITGFHAPLSHKDTQILTFAQHWAIFANLATLYEAQKRLLQRLQAVVSRHQAFLSSVSGGGSKSESQQQLLSKATSFIGSTTTTTTTGAEPTLAGEGKAGGEKESAGGSMTGTEQVSVNPTTATTAVKEVALDTEKAEHFLHDVVLEVYNDSTMMHFLAEHMMFCINYSRTISPTLMEIINNATTASQLERFVNFTRTITDSVCFPDTLLPEYDPLNVSEAAKKQGSPVESLLVLLAAPLPSLQRYIHTARSLVATKCVTNREDSNALNDFIAASTQRQWEEGSMVQDWISTHEAQKLIVNMDKGWTAAPNDSRVIVHRGRVTKKYSGGRHERLLLLFSDVLCYVEEQENSSQLRVVGLMPLGAHPPTEVMDVDDSYFQQLHHCFEIHCPTGDKQRLTFFANSLVEKEKWIAVIRKQISIAQARLGCPLPEAKGNHRTVQHCGSTSRLEVQRNELLGVVTEEMESNTTGLDRTSHTSGESGKYHAYRSSFDFSGVVATMPLDHIRTASEGLGGAQHSRTGSTNSATFHISPPLSNFGSTIQPSFAPAPVYATITENDTPTKEKEKASLLQ